MLTSQEATLAAERYVDHLIANASPGENTFVEWKVEWPKPEAFAVQLASLGNAARGAPAFLLVGLEDKTGRVVGAQATDLQEFRTNVEARFDGRVVPKILFAFHLERVGKLVHVVVFDTSDPPYVVRPKDASRADQWVIPVRRGSDAEPANRRDLLRMVVPRARAPLFDPLQAGLRSVGARSHPPGVIPGSIATCVELFVAHPELGPVVLPMHDQRGSLELRDGRTVSLRHFEAVVPEEDATTVRYSRSQAVIQGSGLIELRGFYDQFEEENLTPARVKSLRFELRWAFGETPAIIECPLSLGKWHRSR